MKDLVEQGRWGQDISWDLYRSSEPPDSSLCTAVFCVAIDVDGNVVLTKSKRGWGMLGGHIEDGESLGDALIRESIEEGGFTPSNPQLYGFREITARKPILNQSRASAYPFPASYILYYWATTVDEITHPTGAEVIESGSFTIEEIRALNIPDLSVIELALEARATKDS